jgi:hypothetical protein
MVCLLRCKNANCGSAVFKTRACSSGNFPRFPALPCCGPCPKNGLTL